MVPGISGGQRARAVKSTFRYSSPFKAAKGLGVNASFGKGKNILILSKDKMKMRGNQEFPLSQLLLSHLVL